jgi:aspartyl aminopeptidase
MVFQHVSSETNRASLAKQAKDSFQSIRSENNSEAGDDIVPLTFWIFEIEVIDSFWCHTS